MVSAGLPIAVLNRLVRPAEGDLSPELAAFFDRLDFDPADHARIAELGRRAQEGTLAEAERQEYETYVMLDDLLAILRSKARHSLGRANPSQKHREPGRHGG